MNEDDEQKKMQAGVDALAAATAGTPVGKNEPAAGADSAASAAAPAATVQTGASASASEPDLSALNAATQNLAPGQSVQEAGMGAVEAAATAAAQETRDRMRAGREGITSPPSQWAQDVNNLFDGLTSAARRAAERLAQPQQAQAAPAAPATNEPRPITIGRNGLATTEPQPKGALDTAFTAASVLNGGGVPTPGQRELDETIAGFGFTF